MSYRNLMGKDIPQDLLLLPVQYLIFGKRYYCTLFLQIEQDIGSGTFKRVEKAKVVEIIGALPLPEISSLKNNYIALYRPRKDANLFVEDISSIVKLDEKELNNYAIKAYVARIKGHSLFLPSQYQGNIEKYGELLNKQLIKKIPDYNDLMFCLQKSLSLVVPTEQIEETIKEILDHNDLINTPFMFANFLPFDVEECFRTMDDEAILQNVYDIVAMVSYHAFEGVYFRDLRPDNFRVNEREEIRLIDPSYLSSNIKPRLRYNHFIEQTTPEYLPSEWTLLKKAGQESNILAYFGKFTEGVCIGMLERVLKRVFMPEYMGKKYDTLYRLPNTERIEQAHQLKLEEDVDLFKDTSFQFEQKHFVLYRENICKIILREGWSPEIAEKVSLVIEALRKFSRPIVNIIKCHSSLKVNDNILTIDMLPQYIVSLLKITPRLVKATSKYVKTGNKILDKKGLQETNNETTAKYFTVEGKNNLHDRFRTRRRSFADLSHAKLQFRPQTKRSASLRLQEIAISENKELESIFTEIYNKLNSLNTFFVENSCFHNKLKKDCLHIFENSVSKEELLRFFQTANTFLGRPESEQELLDIIQKRVPVNVQQLFKQYATKNYDTFFSNSPGVANKIYSAICSNVIRVVKIRYLRSFDSNAKVQSYLPDLEEDVVRFLMRYDEEHSFETPEDLLICVVSQI